MDPWKTTAMLVTILFAAAGPAGAEARRVEIDRERSFFVARTGTAGLFGFLGHPHGILARDFEAELCLSPDALAASSAEVRVPTRSLAIDTEPALARAGLDRDFDESEHRKLQEKMLGPEALDAATHPMLRFVLSKVEAEESGSSRITGQLTLHGVTREVSFPVRVSGLATGDFSAAGELEILQSDHGIEPESVAGVVKVADSVLIRFELVGRLSDEACSPAGSGPS